jgi:hypothetical protein
MAFADAAAAIRARTSALWPYAFVPLYWANDNANEDSLRAEPLSAFVHVDIVGGAEKPMTRGNPGANWFRQSGEIIARIFVVSGKGDAEARTYADAFAAIFRDQVFADIHCDMGASVAGGGNGARDGNWFQLDVIVPFAFHHQG